MRSIQCIGVTKRFGARTVLDDFSLHVEAGQLLALLGPSGCGKTTLLRLIAGLEQPHAGVIWIGDAAVAGDGAFVTPRRRRVGYVFQDLALWPHMTVARHLDFVLRANKTPRKERRRRIGEMLELTRLDERADAYPAQLSGGQQQRVAIARALVARPDVLLLDEPLANLDAHLRGRMRDEIARLKQWFKVTTIYVTHDPAEVEGLADTAVEVRPIPPAPAQPGKRGFG